MKRSFILLYAILCYLFFLGVFLRDIWFVWTMDAWPPRSPLSQALLVNAVLLGLLATQHSGMARQGFKRAWTKLLPPPTATSTYVLLASAALLALVEFWQPLPGIIWNVRNQAGAKVLQALFWPGLFAGLRRHRVP